MTSYLRATCGARRAGQRVSSRLVTQISLSFTPWRARGQHGAPPIAEGRYYLGACARAASRTSALADCCAIAVASKNCAARHTSGTRRVCGGARSGRCRRVGRWTGDPNLASGARSGLPCSTDARALRSAKSSALGHNNYVCRFSCRDHAQHINSNKSGKFTSSR